MTPVEPVSALHLDEVSGAPLSLLITARACAGRLSVFARTQPDRGNSVNGNGPHQAGLISTKGEYPMRIRSMTVAAVAVLALGAAACTQAEQNQAEAQADAAGHDIANATDDAVAATKDAAATAGEVIESGAMKTAQATENLAADARAKLEANQAEAAAQGRAGAVDPATDTRVPVN